MSSIEASLGSDYLLRVTAHFGTYTLRCSSRLGTLLGILETRVDHPGEEHRRHSIQKLRMHQSVAKVLDLQLYSADSLLSVQNKAESCNTCYQRHGT